MVNSGPRRMFSSAEPAKEASSIFDSAEFFEDDKDDIVESVTQTTPWFDENDTLGALSSMLPKDNANIAHGVSTYGLWEYVTFLDDLFYNMWMTASSTGNMGLCFGLLASTFVTRMVFMPIGIYSQLVGHKMKLLAPDNEEMQAAMKRYT
jgi:membrane protein insertase Oxa1/YidC/SpoIIIJ